MWFCYTITTMNFEMTATAQAPFEADQKEQILQKNIVFKMREKLQLGLMTEQGYDITSPDKVKQFQAISQWAHNESAKDFDQAFTALLSEHPDLLEIFNQNQPEALTLVRNSFNTVHQHN